MAQPAFIVLRANGNTIEAEPSEHDFAPSDGIELVDYSQPGTTPVTAAGVTGQRLYKPIVFRKRIDKASPLIAQAFAENHVLEADVHFFRAESGGSVNEYFRVDITQGRVVSFRELLDDALDSANAMRPPLEEVGLLFHRIKWTYLDGDINYEDTWGSIA
jgi:type VI secretion system secreted protein Hcp